MNDDGAGNRNDSICDNLNRLISISGVTCTSDILGNRLSTGSTSMTWDCLNRMTSLTNNLGTESYAYRADGMRVSKANGANGTTYRYDGQMAMEDVDTGSNPAVTDYAIGARGIDAISKTVGSNTTVVYPIYDAHGNMMADVSRNGSSFSINDKRSYDAWGNIRSGANTGDPKGRYCANLGHVQDDESNLIYMRARYYDPTSGRFLSEDAAHEGWNWFSYCQSGPVSAVDASGKSLDFLQGLGLLNLSFGMALAFAAFALMVVSITPAELTSAIGLAVLAGAALSTSNVFLDDNPRESLFALSGESVVFAVALASEAGAVKTSMLVAGGLAATAVLGDAAYSVYLLCLCQEDENS